MFEDRPFAPTASRREKARREGNVPRGRDLTAIAVILAGLLIFLVTGPALARQLMTTVELGIAGTKDPDQLADALSSPMVSTANVIHTARSALLTLAAVCLPIMGVLWGTAVFSQWMQVGSHWLPEKVAADLTRVDPFAGTQRMFRGGRWADGVLALLRLVLGALVVVCSLWLVRHDLVATANSPFISVASATKAALWVLITAAIALAVIAVCEYGFRWWDHERGLWMTAEEHRLESRGQDGELTVRSLSSDGNRNLPHRNVSGESELPQPVATNLPN